MRPTSLGQIHLASAWLLICLLAKGLPVAAKISPDESGPANPFVNPKDDPYNPLGYIASDVLAGFAFGVHAHEFKLGAWWMGCMTIGAYSITRSTTTIMAERC